MACIAVYQDNGANPAIETIPSVRFTSGVRILGIPNVVAKSLAKYASVSAMIGSHIIWRQRGQIVTK